MNARSAARPAVAVLLAVVAGSILAGCTGSAETSKPEATDATQTATPVPQATTLTCIDGFMLIDSDALTTTKKAKTIDVKCDLTSVVGSGADIVLHGTKNLVVEGDRNHITLDGSTSSVRLSGNENTVKHSSTAPTIDDKGAGNSIGPSAK